MVQICIIHPDIKAKGGAEFVFTNVLQALTEEHSLTVITERDVDADFFRDYYGITLNDFEVIQIKGGLKLFTEIFRRRITSDRIPDFNMFKKALFDRYASNRGQDFDLRFSTYNEYVLAPPSILYIHHPNYYPGTFPDSPERDGFKRRLYDDFSRWVAGFDFDELADSRLLANSEWTAERFADHYGHRPEVLYPPVDTTGLDGLPWDDREDGFVAITRISPDKRVLDGIEILDELRERGHDLHLHVVGSITHEKYYEEVQAIAAERPYVTVEGELPREELTDLVGCHKYGLHTKPAEHFGIAVAELVAGGTVPFVPEEGGQREIVSVDDLSWKSTAEAVDAIEAVVTDPYRQADLRARLPDVEERFGCDRFRDAIRDIVAEELERTGEQ
ncbi:glycosyltransferase family 4 protein [Haloarcula litorea]|uniref:glycosyltransferase family 4 protein n=1 Tax=Haloarcula litorea TaxID=3032579 RepID=UPI0023E7FB58|nr:glycosyltransferase family 4 protein [Halomicroarcula sp. GDY20]